MNNYKQSACFAPAELIAKIPLSTEAANTVENARSRVKNVLRGVDDRILVIVGPCSIHDYDAALEYGKLLKAAAEEFASELCLIMRVYLEKPRTTIGWKGLINDPSLNQTYDIPTGLTLARNLLLELNSQGISTATEFLNPLIAPYLADFIAWSAVGARNSASQVHRELASSLSMPVGFKNTTDGNVNIAVEAVVTAAYPHHFISNTLDGAPCIIESLGNKSCHIVLRGSQDGVNYQPTFVNNAAKLLREANLIPKLIVDCSHGNSAKNFKLQKHAAKSLCDQVEQGSTVIAGIMLESNLVEGKQTLSGSKELVHGQSITDSCLGWEDTHHILKDLAFAALQRRKILKKMGNVSPHPQTLA